MKSKSDCFEFIKFESENISSYLSIREGETKIGEKIGFEYISPTVKYVIIGISEDIGPQANLGLHGSNNTFKAFITRFVNTQSNRFLSG
jgi:formiminoglutamase